MGAFAQDARELAVSKPNQNGEIKVVKTDDDVLALANRWATSLLAGWNNVTDVVNTAPILGEYAPDGAVTVHSSKGGFATGSQKREEFDAWMPANVDVMGEMRMQNRGFEVLMHLRQMEDGIDFSEFAEFANFWIWRHYRRVAMLDDPTEVFVQWRRIQSGQNPVDEVLEHQLYNQFANEREEDMDMLAQHFRTYGRHRDYRD